MTFDERVGHLFMVAAFSNRDINFNTIDVSIAENRRFDFLSRRSSVRLTDFNRFKPNQSAFIC
jgi:hypothetical protein